MNDFLSVVIAVSIMVSCCNRRFVVEESNTILVCDEPRPDRAEPPLWFYDIYHQDKSPFDQAEIDIIKNTNGK